MKPPLAASFLLAWAILWLAGPVCGADPKPKPIKPDPALVAFLKSKGYALDKDLSPIKTAVKVRIPLELLKKADLDWDPKGHLIYKSAGPVEQSLLIPLLDGLLPFAKAQALSAEEVGKVLQSWGVPPAFNGQHLLNPDGSATYFGRMFYQGVKDKPAALSHLSGERMAKSLDLFENAYHQAFDRSGSDLAEVDLERAWGLLGQDKLKAGETPLVLKPYADMGATLDAYKTKAQGVLGKETDAAKKAELKKSLLSIDALKRSRYHSDLELGGVPPPSDKKTPPAHESVGLADTSPPSQTMLPGLLKLFDRINGTPLTAEQQESLIKSFPMGETVWRMGAQDLWRHEITGKGVKVAVIDTGVGPHRDLENAVKSRANFTRQRGAAAYGDHATHVAGTISALAPDAEIRSYRVLSEGGFKENWQLSERYDEVDANIIAAIDKAAADGNQVINMSLGVGGAPSGALTKKIEEYSKKGVIFVISAGNNGPGGVNTPSVAPSAVTVGALTVNDRVASFSSYGEVFDPAKVNYAIKKVFLAPGDDIISSVAPTYFEKAPYRKMSGTSMAAPHASGLFALLTQQAAAMNKTANPLALSRLVRDAVTKTAVNVPRNQLAPEVPPDQDFLIIDPRAAYRKLRSRGVGSVGK